MEPEEGAVTVVIPTHNRYDRLKALLASIERSAPPYLKEVVVVDDSPRWQEIPSSIGPIPVRHHVLASRALISASKNIGWRAASTEYVFFIDDDNVVDGRTFEPLCSHMFSSQCIAALMPSVLYERDRGRVWVYCTPFASGRWSHVLVGRNRPRNPVLEGKLEATDALPNASLVRKRALEAVGGFEESLSVNSSCHLCVKLKLSGWKVLADTGSFIYHDVDLPATRTFWAKHAIEDPERVLYEVRDWFILMRLLHPALTFFRTKAVLHSLKFILPNTAAYVTNGGSKRRKLLLGVVGGLIEGLRGARGDGK